jgi:biotin carboxylase
MILGGIPHMLDIVSQAKAWGMYTIVCDYDPVSPSKAIADKSYNVSTTDIDSLVEIGSDLHIDGVFNAFEDLNTWSALKICERLNLPFYASERQLQIASDKLLFKEMCMQCGLPVTQQYVINDLYDLKQADTFQYPVIVKPSDNYGSKGITVCKNADAFSHACNKALDFSRQQKVIVEHFYEGDGVELYYTVVNGIPYLSATTDRYVFRQDGDGPPLPTATIFPSKYTDQLCKPMHEKISAFIEKLKIRNGVILFQTVRDKDSLYFYEMAFRLTGEKHYQIVKRETGMDLLKMMLILSVYGNPYPFIEKSSHEMTCSTPACNLAVLLKKGKIQSIRGLDEIEQLPEFISCVQTLNVGDEITKTGSYGQMCLRFNFWAETKTRLLDIIDFINRKLIIVSNNDDDMILSKFKETNI